MRQFILALGLLAGITAQAATLADVLDKAWLRLPQAQSQASREVELKANQAAASSMFPSPPALGLGHRSDRFNRNSGSREYEVELSVPLWLPGEKTARQRLATSESGRFTAEQLALRLQLAGQLREAIWQVKLAETAQELVQNRLVSARQIEADVARRVKAGESARTDLLLVQSETMAAQVALADADRTLIAARQAYKRIVGDDAMPPAQPEAVALDRDIAVHPLLVSKRNRVEVVQAKARLVSETRRDNPELSLGARRERGEFNERFGSTLAVSVKIPFGTESRNAPRIAAAQAESTEAEIEYQRQRFDIEQDIQKARADVEIAKQRSELAGSRRSLAEENLQLIKKAFSLGERSLFEFQRTQALLNDAALAASEAKIEMNLTYARLNQAMGVLP
ncbi:MAG: hypothetical protein A3I66_22520 [Burkholderiales bacterium RIFCSPLOWO2_02_FULL_57_36]|nr:MAG: hypothetical protein A3I66_22520 [Burkholderiales bacterium RIFCSPLOWO2_02_FULL_57_36]